MTTRDSNGQEPLLARGPASDHSGDLEEEEEEEDALLTGQRTNKQQRQRRRQHRSGASTASVVRSRWKEIGLFVWALVATGAVVVLGVVYQHALSWGPAGSGSGSGGGGDGARPSGKRNLIFMVSDGMGPTSMAMTRSWRQHTEQVPWDEALVLDEYLIGQSRTRSTSSLVTDSAAGATAFSCGLKSYNGAISVLPDHSPCGSVMEAAKRKGYTTGLVVTTRITDATPAVFASHVRRREMEDGIAMLMVGATHPLGRMVDLMLGGGRCKFVPIGSEGSCRNDDVDVREVAGDRGWNYISTREEFDSLGTEVKLPLLGLFAHDDIPYELDRQYQNATYPSLEEMARTALDALSVATKDSDQGFFVMIEGSRIDHAGHANDPAAQVHEVLAYGRTVAAVMEFIKHSETPTLMVSTSDHETGGLATARQLHSEYPHYHWYPGVLTNVSHSGEYLSREYHAHLSSLPSASTLSAALASSENTKTYLTTLIADSLGIHDPSDQELDLLLQRPAIAAYVFADMVSRRAQTRWSTHGHSGADVNIYSSDSRAARRLAGSRENTDVGGFLRWYLDLEEEVGRITDELRGYMGVSTGAGDTSWLGSVPGDDERLDGQDHLDHYAGDHRRREVGGEGCEQIVVECRQSPVANEHYQTSVAEPHNHQPLPADSDLVTFQQEQEHSSNSNPFTPNTGDKDEDERDGTCDSARASDCGRPIMDLIATSPEPAPREQQAAQHAQSRYEALVAEQHQLVEKVEHIGRAEMGRLHEAFLRARGEVEGTLGEK
ncbi:hypothetical protein B0A55_05592 [Friedmanniomyces simplex]|uniref:Alkaline phosphatase n=1 Tax=Friedmanniomyces simplex TaxID=329884 RepID=A0A4U0XE25_9PEZI|nr:hypothetical protein B0A55_05592 [Friedmanniomyces simplex]